jgi:hypothetical protein
MRFVLLQRILDFNRSLCLQTPDPNARSTKDYKILRAKVSYQDEAIENIQMELGGHLLQIQHFIS